MKCRRCGNEVDIGEVFCQKCGTAIQIVPDYSPLEDQIEAPFEEAREKRKAPQEQEQERKRQRREAARRKKQAQQRMLLIGSAAAVVLLLCIGAAGLIYYQNIHSFSHQRSLGLEHYEKEEYGAAIQCFREALEASHEEREGIEVRLTMAECYQILGDYDRMVELLLEIVNIDKSPVYYQKLMEACELAGNTQLMNRILKETQGTPAGDALAEYRTGQVSADLAGGEYHDYLSVSLTSSQKGSVIYYTLDGSEPTAASMVYTGPIAIESVGTKTLRAIAVNEAGLAGEEFKAVYTISLVVPDAPAIAPESGKYEYPEMIEITVPEGGQVYYTIDGTVPNQESSYLYTEPVPMPVGNTIFSAIVVDKYGVASMPAKKNYECSVDRPFPYDAAVIKLKNYLVSLGIMADLNGNRGNGERISVQFVELADIAGPSGEIVECYVYTLRRTVDGETATLSEMLYAVTTETGEVYTLTAAQDDGYSSQQGSTQE